MKRRHFLSLSAAAGALTRVPRAAYQTSGEAKRLQPGIWKFSLGAPERITPVTTRRYSPATLDGLPTVDTCPVPVAGSASRCGYLVSIPLEANEIVYGLGLQMQSFIQRGLKKKLRVNADPKVDSGDSHAPVPFYVTTRGYGVLIDTARYANFYCGNKQRKGARKPKEMPESESAIANDALPAAYKRYRFGERSEVLVEIPEALGVDVYVFGGPTMRQAVQRYNLFAGGGALPPRWGLGVWYRCDKDHDQGDVLKLSAEFRDRRIPCDVIGLEPGWQTHAYSCTYVWGKGFPEPGDLIRKLNEEHYRLNLWEHAFTNPASPIYEALLPLSGDFEVWAGIVPDFLLPEAREIFANFHEKEHVVIGVSGYKLDECDNSDFTGNWSFPEISSFPSGADGEQMHSLFGLRYQDTIQGIFDKRKIPTYGLVRSSQALAAPYPYVLYSDLYDHAEFIRSVAKAGFSGLLWTPEVRNASSHEDLIRRLQAVVFSPMALINAWYIKNPPWKQINRELNNAGKLDPDWETLEAECRRVLELRMRFLPYLHAAFVRYQKEGLPPFRALVMDHPDDTRTWAVDDQFMMGDALLVAPVISGKSQRTIYLPVGEWFDYWNGKRYSGKQVVNVSVPLEQIPLFVKAGTLLPLAESTLHTEDPGSLRLTVLVYGERPAPVSLYEEGNGVPRILNEVRLSWDSSSRRGSVEPSKTSVAPHYEVVKWNVIA
ncbi:MAG TPA: TIM-barrel domain-containing protein [Candidatus Dormibacteraeota bacterium]|nr:TIM-barrel domain-containing protein [Candidatus Dormibacteraeota bacterium]